MGFSPVPKAFYPSVLDIRPEELTDRGITLLLADLDNTLVPYKTPEPDEALIRWRQQLQEGGVQLCLLSNSRKPTRPKTFAAAIGLDDVGHAGKPKRAGFLQAMERTGRTPAQTAMVGDQIFTDILGGNRAGVTTLLVQPIRLAGNPGRYVRYWAETPFRLLARLRGRL